MVDYDRFSCRVMIQRDLLDEAGVSDEDVADEWEDELQDLVRALLSEVLEISDVEVEVKTGLEFAGTVEFTIKMIGVSVADHESIRAALCASETLTMIDDDGDLEDGDSSNEEVWRFSEEDADGEL